MNVGNSLVHIMQYFNHKFLEPAGNNINLNSNVFVRVSERL